MSRCNDRGDKMRIPGGKVPTFVSNYNGLNPTKAYEEWFKYTFSYFSDSFIGDYGNIRPLSTPQKMRITGGGDKK